METQNQTGYPVTALIYARVSDKSQLKGSGLQSQEHRCRQYAKAQGYDVEEVFLDTVSGGKNDIFDRPAMHGILNYLDKRQYENKRYIVIFDDHKRFARLTEMHLHLRREFAARGAIIEFLNLKTEDTPEGRFTETIFAAQAQLEREQGGVQSKQKTKARLEQGYWTRRAPRGYKYITAKGGGRELIVDEPIASILKEALEGFVSGRFASQTEVRRFLERQPEFPKDMPNGELRAQTVPRLLRQKLYSGYLEAPSWGVSLRKAQHEALISFETFQRIQAKLDKGVYAPMRKDISKDFPLRGAVACSGCNNMLTAAWCKGKYKKYPYYLCQNKGCDHRGKAVARDKLEDRFKALLKQLTPSKELFELAKVMFDDLWQVRQAQAKEQKQSARTQIVALEKQIGRLLDQIVEAQNVRVIKAYEGRIAALETNKLLLEEKATKPLNKSHSYRDLIKLSFKFLENPQILWDTGNFALRRLVLKLAFSEPITHDRNTGLLNTKLSLPFKALGGNFMPENKMVLLGRIELPTSSLPKQGKAFA
ncbi:hypothetical protein A8B75_18750 [Sphingomonadales bacterium EhC05]|nr:hypothetical protein A8B75_18750 [Sphingomonadales bacterium EhC05]